MGMLLPSRYHRFDGGVRVGVVWMPCGAFSAPSDEWVYESVIVWLDKQPDLVFKCFILFVTRFLMILAHL